MNAGFVKGDNLAGEQIPLRLCSNGSQGTAFGGYHIHPLRGFAVAQWAEAPGVTGSNELGGGHHHQGIGSLHLVHGAADGGLNGGGFQPLLGDDVGNDFRVAGSVEDGTAQLQGTAQFKGIAEVTVVCQCQLALHVVDHNGLAVRSVGCAGGAVAHMGNGHGSRRKFFHHIPGEHLANLPQISVGGEHSIIVYNDAAALLPPVLQGVQPIVSEVRHILRFRRPDTKHTAFFVKVFHCILLFAKKETPTRAEFPSPE